MAVKDTGPLDWQVPIVDNSGRPSPEFQRRWNQQRTNNDAIGIITTGSGAPTGTPKDGQGYVDIAAVPPAEYVGFGGVWKKVGVFSFTQLADAPSSYTGSGGKLVKVNPGATGLTFGSLGVADLPSIGDGNIYANVSGGVASPTAQSLSAVLDYVLSSTRGSVLYRGATGWRALGPGASGQVLQTNGAGADPSWATASGGGGGSTTLLSEIIAPGTSGTVTFSSIPTTYRDLKMLIRARGDAAATTVVLNITFNGDTGANYDYERLTGNNTAASANNSLAQTSLAAESIVAGSAPVGLADFLEIYIANYRDTNFQKAGYATASLKVGTSAGNLTNDKKSFFWRSTAAINSITVALSSGNFAANSVISLYGCL